MPKVKLPRKSTNIDMTAMCDVAFLLLSFFIMATKQKPPEAVAVKTPSSIAKEVVKDKAVLWTVSPDDRVFLMIGDDKRKGEILAKVNEIKALGLSPAELTKLGKMEYIGVPFNQIKSALSTDIPADKMAGIPCKDSANEVKDWMNAVMWSYTGVAKSDFNLLVKGDQNSKYPSFKNLIEAFQANEQLRFKLVTNPEGAPPTNTEFYKNVILKGGGNNEEK